MEVLKVKVISLPYIFQVLYVLCFTRPRYQVSVYRTIGPLVLISGQDIECRYTLELRQLCFRLSRNIKKILYILFKPCFIVYRWGSKGCKL